MYRPRLAMPAPEIVLKRMKKLLRKVAEGFLLLVGVYFLNNKEGYKVAERCS